MPGRLTGKRALVTGGGNGIGRAICQVFAREGAQVAVVDIDEGAAHDTMSLLEKAQHCVIKCDVSNVDEVVKAFKAAEQQLGGKCNIVANNAGILGDTKGIAESDSKTFDRVIDVNLKGMYLVAKEFIKSVSSLDEEIRGVLINMSSLAGKIGFANNVAYSASKSGVIGLTKSIAGEFPIYRVRCNVVLPGFTETSLLDPIRDVVAISTHSLIPMQRTGKPEEIANGFLFLASDESSFVHGACLEITGGMGM